MSRQSTEEHLRESESSSKVKKGLAHECDVSAFFHKRGIPLLVCSNFLRKRSMGQLDVCTVINGKIVVAECKFGDQLPNTHQRKRLIKSCHFLGSLFDLPVKLEVVNGFAKSFESA